MNTLNHKDIFYQTFLLYNFGVCGAGEHFTCQASLENGHHVSGDKIFRI